jgi:hypothetical protein
VPAKRVLIIANEAVADRPAGVPEVVRRQVLEAEEVRVIAPTLTTRLQSWASDGHVGDEDPVQAVADALANFPADALILAVHAPDAANWRERRFADKVRERFDLPVTEMLLDREGRVVSVTQ